MKLFGRQKQHPELHRQSSDESYSSTAPPSTSKTHRRSPSSLFKFNEWSLGAAQQDPGSDASVKSNATDPLNMSWSSSGSVALSSAYVMMDRRSDSTMRSDYCLDGGVEEDKRSTRALEIIRQLSFSPPRRTKKRADTADTASSSSSSDADYEDSTSSMGLLDLQQLEDLRRGSPSPLLGLQYLPDEQLFI